jgi:hypothetical protein
MISPDEIKQQALKWWKPFLQSHVAGQDFFPKSIDRIGKIKSSQVLADFNAVQNQVSELYNYSKTQLGYGYIVKTAEKNFRRTGSHDLPDLIEFDSPDDYIRYVGKTKEWQTFLKNHKLVLEAIPFLKDWILANPDQMTISGKNWLDILKVCQYFLINPRPELYIRQLPIEVHTKFIENNEAILKSLLDFLIPDHITNSLEKSFAKRYHLKYDEPPQIRLRILDQQLSIANLTDLLIKVSDFKEINTNCRNIILTENKMNFLTLPDMPCTLAIWSGGGFNISYLKGVKWLREKKIFYWGDLDIQGFHILHQMRSYYPQTISLMMDRITLSQFKDDIDKGQPGSIVNLELLTAEEKSLFQYLKEGNLRLEQEKISQSYADSILKNILDE